MAQSALKTIERKCVKTPSSPTRHFMKSDLGWLLFWLDQTYKIALLKTLLTFDADSLLFAKYRNDVYNVNW